MSDAADNWSRVRDLFSRALDLDPAARPAFLREACGGDSGLQAEVTSLLAAHADAGSMAEGSPLEALDASAVSSLLHGLRAGDRLGPYDIVGPLGAGGMGEVYEARDTLLGRRVALKILSAELAPDASARDRLVREAKALAALNHPNIAAIYGVETTKSDTSGKPATALVLELIEGHTLAERVASGPLSIAETLRVGTQIAGALEAAHEKGIVHRDLKPANIKVTPTGTVKVLDFGLAKVAPRSPSADAATSMMTGLGTVLGTPAYMSPEQVRGEEADTRTDVWALGCVLFELLTGRRAFGGGTASDCVAAVLEREPEWSALPQTTPEGLRGLLRRCLQKDRTKRLRDIGDARFALEDSLSRPREKATVTGLRKQLVLVLALVAVTAALGFVAWGVGQPTALRAPLVSRLEIVPPDADPLNVSTPSGALAMSPDGKRVAYTSGPSASGGPLIVRDLSDLTPRSVDTGTPVRDPFFSADGQWIGYWVGQPVNAIRKVPAAGGTPVTIVAQPGGAVRGASWSNDGSIVFATADPDTGLMRVSEAGGAPVALTTPNRDAGESDHLFPWVLPNGRGILFTIVAANTNETGVAVLDLENHSYRVLIPGATSAQYVEDGFLVYAKLGGLSAVRFNLDRLEIEGAPDMLADQVLTGSVGGSYFGVSRTGLLAFVPPVADQARFLVWVDRAGNETPLDAPQRPYTSLKLSPNGDRVAVSINDQKYDVWTWHLTRNVLTKVTNDSATDAYPLWMPDGERVVFRSDRDGVQRLYWQAADGSDAAVGVAPSPAARLHPGAIARSGEVLLGSMAQTDTWRLFAMPLRGKVPAEPVMEHGTGRFPDLSHNERFLAYQAFQSGLAVDTEIYVRPFPNVNDSRWQLSTKGGSQPLWARNGRELFFLDREGRLTVVEVDVSGAELRSGATMTVLSTPYWRGDGPHSYDVSVDGARFLMIKQGPAHRQASHRIVVVLNAFVALTRDDGRQWWWR